MLWRKARGRWIIRAYRSGIDGSIQPYAVLLPKDYGADLKKKWPFEIVLHGRDSSLTEAKFIGDLLGEARRLFEEIRQHGAALPAGLVYRCELGSGEAAFVAINLQLRKIEVERALRETLLAQFGRESPEIAQQFGNLRRLRRRLAGLP